MYCKRESYRFIFVYSKADKTEYQGTSEHQIQTFVKCYKDTEHKTLTSSNVDTIDMFV